MTLPLKTDRVEMLKAAQRVFVFTLGLNLLVSFSKLVWGYHTHTLSLMADGFHSLLDAVANVVGIVGLNFSMKPADQDHPYGHRKFEAFASMIISFFIFITCFEIAGEGFKRFFLPVHTHPAITITSYVIIGLTLAVNIFTSWYEARKARELDNELLAADARHTYSDCLVSVSVMCSMAAVQMGFLWADTILAIIVALLILRVGFDIIMVHLGALMDEAVLDPGEVKRLVLAVPGVMDCHKIRSRGMQDNIFIDLHIQVDPQLSVKEAHGISYAVEDKLESHFEGKVKDVLVHVEEYDEGHSHDAEGHEGHHVHRPTEGAHAIAKPHH